MSFLEDAYKLSFQISPIILTDGIASSIPGSMLPIISITEAANFVTGILDGGDVLNLDHFFAHFEPIQGSTLIENSIGRYPFASQQVAANAIIVQPLRVSLRMYCPVKTPGGYVAKLATMIALQKVLAKHNLNGGTYTVATPSYIYTNLILTSLRDITGGGDSKQVMYIWQWDFEQPLITLQQADQAQNSLMSKLSNGTPTDGSLSGPGATVGMPATGAGPSTIPAASGLTGASVGGFGS